MILFWVRFYSNCTEVIASGYIIRYLDVSTSEDRLQHCGTLVFELDGNGNGSEEGRNQDKESDETLMYTEPVDAFNVMKVEGGEDSTYMWYF